MKKLAALVQEEMESAEKLSVPWSSRPTPATTGTRRIRGISCHNPFPSGVRKSLTWSSAGTGGVLRAARFPSARAIRRIPTGATAIPGVGRTNRTAAGHRLEPREGLAPNQPMKFSLAYFLSQSRARPIKRSVKCDIRWMTSSSSTVVTRPSSTRILPSTRTVSTQPPVAA